MKSKKKARCRFNRKHEVLAENLYDHEDTCPNRLTNKDVFVCPYNKRHVLSITQKQLHLEKCLDKKLIKVNPEEEKIKADIQKYIEQTNQQKQQDQMNWNDWSSIPDNENTSNSISQSQTQNDNCSNKKQTQVVFSEDDKIFSMVYV
jgi:hypothetical protein